MLFRSDVSGLRDLVWLRADGSQLIGDAWREPAERVFAGLIGRPGRTAAPLMMLINGGESTVLFTLPDIPEGTWEAVFDSSHPRGLGAWHGQGGSVFALSGHSLVVLAAAGHALAL